MIKKEKLLQIESVKYLDRHSLQIIFSDGKKQIVDFEPFLENSSHPEIRKFLNLKLFKKFTFHDGELMWGDFDLIFPLIDLYENNISHEALSMKKRRSSTPGR
jgi:hypothetical protein